jgi:hypothetical protein
MMLQSRWLFLVALGLVSILTGSSRADRTVSSKAIAPTTPGPRGDITVPYTTNGNTTLGVYGGVSPAIISNPLLIDPNNPQMQPNFNLIFYPSMKGFSSSSVGATQRPPNQLRPNR